MEGKRRGGRSDAREVVELVEETVQKEEWTQRFLGIVCLSLSLYVNAVGLLEIEYSVSCRILWILASDRH